MEKKRSVGVMVFGILALLFSFAYLTEISILSKVLDTKIVVLMGFGFLISGIFLLKLKNWARILFLFTAGAQSLVYIWWNFTVKRDFLEHLVLLFVAILLFLIFYYFFTRPKIKEQFK